MTVQRGAWISLHLEETEEYRPMLLAEEQRRQISTVERIEGALREDGCRGFFAYEGGEVIGFALVREFSVGRFFLWDFMVDYRWQGQGKGKLFLQLLIDRLKIQHSAQILTTTYVCGNVIAQKLYESFGFCQTDIVDEGDIHEVNMELIL